MAAPQPTSPAAKRKGAAPRGLSWKEWVGIAMLLAVGLGLAAVLMFIVPMRMVSEQDYRCPPAATAPSQATTSEFSVSCLGRAGADGIDDQALGQARAAVRAPFGVLSAGLLAGAAAAIGVVVSNHNAVLTRDALNAAVKTNKITKKRDGKTAARDRHAADRERERAADDRFTTAIDQLGHPAASVRLGGMHSLHRLAQSDPGRLPTVVDVLCAYLRQPFHHPDHDWNRSEHLSDAEPPPRAWWSDDQKERDERDSERQVRATATRLMPDLLPPATAPPQDSNAPRPTEADEASPPLEINLDGAMLDGLDLSGRRTGSLRLNGAHIDGDLVLGDGAHINGDLMLRDGAHINGSLDLDDGAHITGGLHLDDGAHITGGLQLNKGAHITGELSLDDGAHITRSLRLSARAHIDGGLRLTFGARIDGGLILDDGAHIDGGVLLTFQANISDIILLNPHTHITGNLSFDAGAHITRNFALDTGAHIDGNLQLNEGTHIDGDLMLGEGTHINGYLQVGPGAHIDGNLVTAKTAVARGVRLDRKAMMDPAWFQGWNVPLQ